MANGIHKRPERTFSTGAVTRALRVAAPICTAFIAGAIYVLYSALPEQVATHFNFFGEADAYGPKSSIWLIAGTMLALVSVLTWLSARPQLFNYPVRVTVRNAQLVYRAGERTMVWLNVALVAIFLGMTLATFNVPNPLIGAGLIACPVIVVAAFLLARSATTHEAPSARKREVASIHTDTHHF